MTVTEAIEVAQLRAENTELQLRLDKMLALLTASRSLQMRLERAVENYLKDMPDA